MASLFRYGQQEKLGSSRKIQHGCRRLPPFSPYSRPPEPTALATLPLPAADPPAGESSSWLRGLLSGAGKIISSVVDSDSGDSSSSGSSSGYSSDEDYGPIPNEHGDHLPSKERTSFSKEQGECMEGGNFELLAVVPKSESKFVIEQLLMQETFSRVECNEMLKIIQSRVVEITSADHGEEKHHQVPNSFMGRRAQKSFDQNRNLSGMTNYFLSNLSSISPRFYNSEAITPELCNKAVLEAKEWLEDQKTTPCPNPVQECESCIRNINLKEYQGFGDDVSPVELAKLYVQSLPPWRSPSFSNNALNTHAQSLKHSSITGTNSLPQSMDMPYRKEEHYHLRKLPLQSQDTIELGGNNQIQEDANGLVEEIGTSQKVAEVDNIYSDLDTINDEDLISANYSNGDAAISISEVTLRLPDDVSSDLPITQVTGSNNRKHQIGTKIKSNERMLVEAPQPNRVYHRLKKVVSSKIASGRGI